MSVLNRFNRRSIDLINLCIYASEFLITVYNLMPHILMNFSALNDGNYLSLNTTTIKTKENLYAIDAVIA